MRMEAELAKGHLRILRILLAEGQPDLHKVPKIKDYEVVKRLMSLGALAITQEVDVEATTVSEVVADTLDNIELKAALTLIDASFDIKQLERWNAKDQRIRVKNAIAKRITSITEGNG